MIKTDGGTYEKEEFQIEDLINVLSECGLTEISYEENENLKIKIKISTAKSCNA